MAVKCRAQEHSIESPARARTQTAWTGVERTNDDFLCQQFLAKRPNEVVIRKIADNRREQEQVVQNFIQPCPAQLCESAAYIESIIT